MAKKMWGGRFKKKTDKAAEAFLSSFEQDKVLAEYDCKAGIAHVRMLAKAGIIKEAEKKKIVKGLSSILSEARKGKIVTDEVFEDVHTYVQQTLKERIGDVADKLHIARSRNDLVSAETRMMSKAEIKKIVAGLRNVQKAMLYIAKKNKDIVIPGYTHLRHAQPVLFAHYMLAYVEMLERDKARLLDALVRVDASPLGVGALAGTSLHVDRAMLTKELGFAKTMQNSMDAVSDRDFVLEILSCLSILSMHLSRLSEDLIVYSSNEFSFIELDEAFCTGSSMMPHKKNADTLELIRGECAEVYGNLVSAFTMMKGLPLSYNRDMQLDKKLLFNAISIVDRELPILERLIKTLEINKMAVAGQLGDEFLYATDIMEFLMKKGLSHAAAHEAVGKLVAYCVKSGSKISQLSLDDLKTFSDKFDYSAYKLIKGTASVRFKYSTGGTSPVNVSKALKNWDKRLKPAGK